MNILTGEKTKATKEKTQSDKDRKVRVPLYKPNLRVDFVAFCAVISAISLPIVVLLQLANLIATSSKSISYVQLTDGSATVARIAGSQERNDLSVKVFVSQVMTYLASYNLTKADSASLLEVSYNGAKKKLPLSAYLIGFALDEPIRNDTLRELAASLPDALFTGQVQTALKIQYVKVKKISEGKWTVHIVADIVAKVIGLGDSPSTPYNKVIEVRALDEIPLARAPNPSQVEGQLLNSINTILQSRLIITKIEDLSSDGANAIKASPIPSSSAPQPSQPAASTSSSPFATSTPPTGVPGNSGKKFTN